MNISTAIDIAPIQPADQAEARQLILAGLEEHWGWLDRSRNPDLNDIINFYAQSVFLVARQDGQIVATGALLSRPDGVGEIVRMSVRAGLRRQGIATRVLCALITSARERGCMRIVLETTATWNDAIEFYLRNGFHITHYLDGDVYFELLL